MPTSNFHPFNYLLLPLIGIATILCSDSWSSYLVVCLIMYVNLQLIEPKINYRAIFCFVLSLIPVVAATFSSSYLFAESDYLAAHKLSKSILSLNLSLRMFTLATVSFAFMYHMPKEQTIIELTKRNILPVTLGFAMLAAFNASTYLKGEFTRIQIAYQMRFQRRYFSLKILLPLLIAAARYSHNVSISMHSRGLGQKRSYLHPRIPLHYGDYTLWLVNLVMGFYFL